MPGFFHKGIILPSLWQIWVNPNPLDDTEAASGTKAEQEGKYTALLHQGWSGKKTRPTLAKMFSRELVRDVRALFLKISSLKRLLWVVLSPAAELFPAFCPPTKKTT